MEVIWSKTSDLTAPNAVKSVIERLCEEVNHVKIISNLRLLAQCVYIAVHIKILHKSGFSQMSFTHINTLNVKSISILIAVISSLTFKSFKTKRSTESQQQLATVCCYLK